MEQPNMANWYDIKDVAALDSPSLVVYPQRVEENVRKLVGMIDDPDRLRPHIKTHKTAEGIQLMMKHGIRKFKCATIAEAELLGLNGAPDVVLAYQPHGPKAERFARIIKAFPSTKWACLTDNELSARAMAAVFAAHGLEVPVYIDLNIGMNRSGIIPGPDVVELYTMCSGTRGIKPVGLHGYDGQHRQQDFAARTLASDQGFEAVEQLASSIVFAGHAKPVIIVGGSPTFPIHARRAEVECSPGTCIFWDKGYSDLCPEQPFEPAVMLVTRVLSLPTPTRICLDLGHKSVSAENEITKRVYFPEAPELKPVGQSEEHLVLEAPEGHGYQPGDVIYGVPYHICPTVALYERAIAVTDGKVSGEWMIRARDRKINI
jgi:D-serine deaminase-like pyridoxal phosphate-dependent protein